jgi:hypothetical protein
VGSLLSEGAAVEGGGRVSVVETPEARLYTAFSETIRGAVTQCSAPLGESPEEWFIRRRAEFERERPGEKFGLYFVPDAEAERHRLAQVEAEALAEEQAQSDADLAKAFIKLAAKYEIEPPFDVRSYAKLIVRMASAAKEPDFPKRHRAPRSVKWDVICARLEELLPSCDHDAAAASKILAHKMRRENRARPAHERKDELKLPSASSIETEFSRRNAAMKRSGTVAGGHFGKMTASLLLETDMERVAVALLERGQTPLSE